MIARHATVLLSGGQDSTTALYWARQEFEHLDAVSFDYHQRHRSELDAAAAIANRLGIRHRVYLLSALFEVGDSALVADGDVTGTHRDGVLPATFTPARNDLFLSIAAAHAYRDQSVIHLVTGVCMTDYSGYPDCRLEFVNAKAAALTLALDRPVYIHTPLMFLTKSETVQLAVRLGRACLDALAVTVTCYEGRRPGCGVCPACLLRSKGFEDAEVPDPAVVGVPVDWH